PIESPHAVFDFRDEHRGAGSLLAHQARSVSGDPDQHRLARRRAVEQLRTQYLLERRKRAITEVDRARDPRVAVRLHLVGVGSRGLDSKRWPVTTQVRTDPGS